MAFTALSYTSLEASEVDIHSCKHHERWIKIFARCLVYELFCAAQITKKTHVHTNQNSI